MIDKRLFFFLSFTFGLILMGAGIGGREIWLWIIGVLLFVLGLFNREKWMVLDTYHDEP